jgi:hypothetical protein
MKVFYLLLFILLSWIPVSSPAQYPAPVSRAIQLTKTNQAQLKMVLDHFYASGDSLKIRAANFLIANMPIHSSQTYYWADEKGKKIPFDELRYNSFNDAVDAFKKLRSAYPGLHPVATKYRDLDSVTAKFLIENIDLAVDKFRKSAYSKSTSEADLQQYIHPYRVSV